ncbi:type IV secretion system DNA-binding domain-containing protein [Sphingobium yanoikuyae]|uniref:Type IV secretion system DNA-binding domain-containing protein n=1 Tax=Sphingobium yanoikuyae TaxID=13690 RepID=A0AA42WY57_SPHYA|nr:type IV secretion system DNA-binding domain-containing protein [Sphingobium yanoikuyae]MDH2131929.1 type IV secretion system DNA-binding domain-containing protein [Sphingobium yanoikuyae]MDH2150160.1 type IV secretion system DNA-binding domain-containing protein [Sphingobium yanoikuyae]MDH2167583.1 type IV secretion system DNA-binding domain-containing protein [Sphingobium yanoikuyae]
MTRPDDRRNHADALRKHHLSTQGARLKRQALVMLASVALGGLTLPNMMLGRDAMLATGTYYWARTKLWAVSGWEGDTGINVHYPDHIEEGRSARQIIAHPYFRRRVDLVWAWARWGCCLGFGTWLVGLIALRGALARRRERLLADRWIGGTRVVDEKQLARLTGRQADAHTLSIGKVPIPARLETRHMAMIGTTGSGKTTALRQLLDGIEARGEAALVYDTSGEFIAHYYNSARGDVILNPFDARCAFWSPFAEIAHPADADRIAHQLITETGQHDSDVWLDTSRILVANMIRALWQENRRTLPDLLHALKNRPKDDLKEWLATSSSARTFADDADRATGSVLFMLAKAADLIQFLRAEDGRTKPFAFRSFIEALDRHPGARPWIFVPRKEDYFEASKPLLACWLECAASAVLGLPPSEDRRIWFVLDELADLPRVDNLARLLPEGRKFGAAVVLTFQALGQMQHRYGPQIAESMLGCCNTKLFLQTIDSDTRQWASQTIGTSEMEIRTKTDMLGDGDEGHRINLGRMREVRPAVMESQLRLARYEGYLLLPDGLPVARIRLTADHIARRGDPRQPGFVAADPATMLWGQASRAVPPSPEPSSSPSPKPDSQGPV